MQLEVQKYCLVLSSSTYDTHQVTEVQRMWFHDVKRYYHITHFLLMGWFTKKCNFCHRLLALMSFKPMRLLFNYSSPKYIRMNRAVQFGLFSCCCFLCAATTRSRSSSRICSIGRWISCALLLKEVPRVAPPPAAPNRYDPQVKMTSRGQRWVS